MHDATPRVPRKRATTGRVRDVRRARPRKTPLDAWFATRGWRVFAFQREVWDAYLAGESGLLHAPTGHGKTLAVWGGPLLEALGFAPSPAPQGRCTDRGHR
jgi:ATP-dependent helicase YprA (DUF1998 family)